MVSVVFVEFDGKTHEVDAEEGTSLMQAATDNKIDAILAECGGCCSCATCHCMIDETSFAKLAPMEEMENEMLDGVLDRKETSRLSCQISLTKELDGMVVHLPESQY